MKIVVNEHGQIELAEVYEPVVLVTPGGKFGVCQRDGGIEVVSEGKILFGLPSHEPVTSKIQALLDENEVQHTMGEAMMGAGEIPFHDVVRGALTTALETIEAARAR